MGRSATDLMDLLMPTYGNGNLVNRLLYNAINRAYVERVENYYSTSTCTRQEKEGPPIYVEKDGGYIKAYLLNDKRSIGW